ncbi:hypothetical protein BDV36DRAFT_260525 [Aspergillus pseudocaelatus]|uniref:Uncharacterized protein n=1 Tax=Aspergillus pseudocaelatus TaxID=1825620 RepID=A0ABQ6WH01_9EURO|nr:hypothetical protein BDV36DRAFT_260525 [Aspergillus pseudocaelatus]
MRQGESPWTRCFIWVSGDVYISTHSSTSCPWTFRLLDVPPSTTAYMRAIAACVMVD